MLVVCKFGSFQTYVYGLVPPDGIADAVPLFVPHEAMVDDRVISSSEGSIMVVSDVLEHPILSVMVTLYNPAKRPVALAFV